MRLRQKNKILNCMVISECFAQLTNKLFSSSLLPFLLLFIVYSLQPLIWVMEFVDEGASTADCISSKLRNSRRSWRERESCKMICERVQSTKYRVQTCKMICEKRDVVLLLHRSSADTSLCYRATQSSEALIMHCGTVRWCQILALSAILVCHRTVYTQECIAVVHQRVICLALLYTLPLSTAL